MRDFFQTTLTLAMVLAISVGFLFACAHTPRTTPLCDSDVTVYVVNEGFADVRVAFGNRVRMQTFKAGQTDSIKVARFDLRYPIRAVIAAGGVQYGLPYRIDAEHPFCDRATLFLASGLTGSAFFGADLR